MAAVRLSCDLVREHSATMSFLSSQPKPAIASLTDSASSFAMYSLSERLCSCSLAAHSERAAALSDASVRAAMIESMKADMFNDVSCARCVSSDRVKPVGRFAAQWSGEHGVDSLSKLTLLSCTDAAPPEG